MHKDELVYVGHMCDLTRRAVAKVEGKTRSDFDADENLRLVLVPARRVSDTSATLWSRYLRLQAGMCKPLVAMWGRL